MRGSKDEARSSTGRPASPAPRPKLSASHAGSAATPTLAARQEPVLREDLLVLTDRDLAFGVAADQVPDHRGQCGDGAHQRLRLTRQTPSIAVSRPDWIASVKAL